MVTYHLLDAVEALPMETEGLFKQDSVLHCPLIRKWSEVRQVCQRFLNVVFVPEKHPQRLKIHIYIYLYIYTIRKTRRRLTALLMITVKYLLHIVAMLLFGDSNVLIHWNREHTLNI